MCLSYNDIQKMLKKTLSGPKTRARRRHDQALGRRGDGTMATLTATAAAGVRKPCYSVLYIQVLIAVALGIVIGHFAPDTGANM